MEINSQQMFYPQQRQEQQKAGQKPRPPSAKTKLPTTYKDWQVKEEGQNKKKQNAVQYTSTGNKSTHSSMKTTQKPSNSVKQQPKAQNRDIRTAKSRSKSKGRDHSTESAQEIRAKVVRLTNNYIQTKEALSEEISEFNDSQAEPDRDTKARILAEQKVKRKREQAEKKQREEAEAKKQQDNMTALTQRFKSEAGAFRKKLEAEKRSQERTDRNEAKQSRERKKVDKAEQKQGAMSQTSNSNNMASNAAQQMTDLRFWIEEQMKAEHMNRSTQESPSLQKDSSVQNIEVGGQIIPPGPSASVKEQEDVKERTKKEKKSLSSSKGKKKSKSKERNLEKKPAGNQNQSILSNLTVDSLPKQQKEAEKARLLKQQLPGNSMLSEKEQAKLGARKNRYGVFNSDQVQSEFDQVVEIQRQKLYGPQASQDAKTDMIFSHDDQARAKQDLAQALKGLGQRADLNFTDDTPKSESKKVSEADSNHLHISEEDDHQYSMHSDDSTDKVPVRESSTTAAYRQKINKPVKDEDEIHDKLGAKMPGVMNMRSLIDQQEELKRNREAKAVLTIQKNIRGHWGRQEAKRKFDRERDHIEHEYERLNRELKSNTEYNMKQYLAEKKRIREQTGMMDSIPDEIAEVIGESSSIKTEKFGQTGPSIQLQNFFKDNQKGKSSDKDPLSLISIYAKRYGGTPSAEKQKGVPKIFAYDKKSAAKDKHGRKYKKSPHRKEVPSNSSIIEEEYSQDFEESVPKSDSKSDSIKEESMLKGKSSSNSVEHKKPKGLSSGKFGASQKSSGRRSGRFAKEESDSIAEDVIEEESNIPSDTIEEDSIAQEVSDSSRKKKSDSLVEESIIKEEYSQDNFEVYDAKQSLDARNRVRFGIHSGSANAPPPPKTAEELNQQKEALSLMENREMATLERKNMVHSLLTEMKEYEKATMSTAIVERMEKVVAESLAQKDQIIMASRLAQLESEKHHKEEINRIREEQIKLMSQLMLLGAGTQGASGGMTEAQQAHILDSIKKIVEKPIEIKQETVNVNYSVSRDAQELIHASGSHRKMSYLEEYDRSKGRNNSSFQKYSDVIEEDIALRSGQSRSNRKLSKSGSDDDIVDEVASLVEESIKEDIDVSGSFKSGKIAQSEAYKNKAFDDFKTKGYKDAKDDNNSMAIFLSKMQKTINSERNQREEKLAKDLKKRAITPRTYDRKMRELEKWVTAEKKEVTEKMRKIEGQVDVHGSYYDQITSSPKRNQSSGQIAVGRLLNEDSADSDILRDAIRQQKMLEAGLTGMNPDQKYLQKKKEAAQALLEQKEKAIQEGLKAKMENYQEDVAEELIQKALNLDVNEEINRRYQVARRQIEESSQLESARSNLTASQEKTAKQKKVQFHQSVKSDKKSESMRDLGTSVPLDEDSIEESIKIAESISQSIRSQSATEQAKSRSMGSRSKEERYAMTSSAQKESRSEIESDYSEDFEQSAASEKGLSKSMASSKQRLQSKAKDLEESNAYSENFEEETIGQSAQLGEKLTKEQKAKMDTVKEESIDESFIDQTGSYDQSQGQQASISQSANEPESLPSDDIEIPESVHSVDWKIQIAQDTKRSKSDKDDNYTEDNFVESSRQINEEIGDESSSDLNTRDDHGMADLDSCPEEISKSGSKSAGDDLLLKADLIAEELLSAIIDDYKENSTFDLNATNQQPDEDDFRKKFPWTLDKIPEKPPAPKPEGTVKPDQLGVKPAKTQREIDDEKFKEKHEVNQKLIQERQEKVNGFLDFLCIRVDRQKLMESLNKPIEQDPLKILTQIQGYDDEDSMNPLSEDTMMAAQQQILPQSFFNKIDREYVINQRMKQRKIDAATAEISDDLTVSQEETENIQNVHHYALFEALNEALDQERPYKNKGEPMPWSKNTRVVKQVSSLEQAKAILDKAKEQVVVWAKMHSGTNYAPLPEAPPATQDELGEEIVPPSLAEGEEERRNINRQEKLAELMTQDIQDNDGNWVDYEIQDTQTRFDVADMILHHLAGEIAEFLQMKANEQ